MNEFEMFNFTLDSLSPLMDNSLMKNGLSKENIDLFVPHQANKFMLNTLCMVYGVSKDKFYIDLKKTGNTVSSTVPIALKDAMDKNIIQKGLECFDSWLWSWLFLWGYYAVF